MGKGFLKINLFVGEHLLPIQNSKVLVKEKSGDIIYELISDEIGYIEKVSLYAPDITDENTMVPDFATYDVEVPYQNGYQGVIIHDVEIFDTHTTILPIQIHPAIVNENIRSNTEEYYTPIEARTVQECRRRSGRLTLDQYSPEIFETTQLILANEVAIPNYITVHLGSPNSVAASVRVPFIDYVKNVASREVYPTWTESTLTANILVQMTFAINRMYNLHYRSQLKDFDITNQTQWDQAYNPNAGIFEIMSNIVDRIFTGFIRREGRQEPFFSSYCNGTTSTCAGLYQCESQLLGLAGYTPIQILRHYYPNDVQIVYSNNFTENIGRFPGHSLKEGNSGEDVLRMQIYLNRISGNWWVTPIPVNELNGYFGRSTTTAVIMFQRSQGVTADGIIGRTTWYLITRIYTAAARLSELDSEGQRIGIGTNVPTVTLYPNTNPVTRGEYVVKLQFLLNYISQFYSSIPYVIQNGVFRDDTRTGVIAFQREFGLTTDGIVGPGTWQKLYEVYHSVQDDVIVPPPAPEPPVVIPPTDPMPPYPGTALRNGSRGSDVLLMQTYLNAISRVYPSIPTLTPDGIFGPMTQSAVVAFQRIFGLTADGIIGPITWYKIIEIYNNLSFEPSPQFPGTLLRVGSRGNDVLLMQRYLNVIRNSFPIIPRLAEDGIFGPGTQNAVIIFQSLFGLSADGIIGRITWDKIVYVYNSVPTLTSPQYPGTVIRVGSRGNDVVLMQRYLNTIARQYPSIPTLTEDGIFGPGTERAVIAFQRQFGLTPDGLVGINTWNQMVTIFNLLSMNSTRNILPSNSPTNGANDFNKYSMLLAASMFKNKLNN